MLNAYELPLHFPQEGCSSSGPSWCPSSGGAGRRAGVIFYFILSLLLFYFFEPDRGGLERTADSTHVRSRGGAGLDAGGSARPRDAGECLLLLLFLSVVIVTIVPP